MSDKRASPPRALACLPSLSQKPRAGPALEAITQPRPRPPQCYTAPGQLLAADQQRLSGASVDKPISFHHAGWTHLAGGTPDFSLSPSTLDSAHDAAQSLE